MLAPAILSDQSAKNPMTMMFHPATPPRFSPEYYFKIPSGVSMRISSEISLSFDFFFQEFLRC